MKPFDETDLAAYHLGDLPPRRARLLEKALRADAHLAAESEVYASMLRNFKDHAPLEVDEAAVERNWQRIQPRLPRYGVPLRLSPRRVFAVAATGLTFVAAVLYVHTPSRVAVIPSAPSTAGAPPASSVPKQTLGEPPAVVSPTSPHGGRSSPRNLERSRLIADLGTRAPRLAPDAVSADATGFSSSDAGTPLHFSPSAPTPLPTLSPSLSSSSEPVGNAHMSQPGTTTGHRRDGLSKRHEHTTDVTLAMGGLLIPTRSLNAGSATQVDGASHAVSAIGSFHQQLHPFAGYRVAVSYSQPDFNFENSSYGGVHINARIYEVAGTYVVQGPRRGFLSTALEAGAGLMTLLPTNSSSYTITDRRVAAIVGVTANVALSKHVAVQAGYRLQVFHAPNFQVSGSEFPLPTPVASSTLLSNEPSLGIVYRFSR